MTNNKKLEEKIMQDIKSGQIKLRSRYIFLAEKFGLGSSFILSVLLAVLFFNLLLFYLKSADSLAYLAFGLDGLLAFWESFPYLLVIGLIVFLFCAGYLMTKSDISYKKPFGYLAVVLAVFVMIGGGILAYTDVSEKIEQKVYTDRPVGNFLRPFFAGKPGQRGWGVVGKIAELNDRYCLLRTPRGSIKVNFPKDNFQLQPGQLIMAIGKRQGEDFWARRIRVVDVHRMPIVERRIQHRFRHCATSASPICEQMK